MEKTIGVLFLIFVIACLGITQQVNAKTLTETQKLGITAGTAYACGADQRLKNYELIVSYILKNKSKDANMAQRQVKEYAQAKFDAYRMQRAIPNLSCSEVLYSFYNLPLLKSVVYKNGTIKLPDGKLIKPYEKR